jgi:hypothetical protein
LHDYTTDLLSNHTTQIFLLFISTYILTHMPTHIHTQAVQDGFYSFLRDRGVDEDLSYFVLAMSRHKEQKVQ